MPSSKIAQQIIRQTKELDDSINIYGSGFAYLSIEEVAHQHDLISMDAATMEQYKHAAENVSSVFDKDFDDAMDRIFSIFATRGTG